ncbi:MAG: hypothetical protein AAF666_16045 [Pseudomonadota bacterium]
MSHTGAHSGHTHSSHLDLLPVDADGNAAKATHVAVNNGDWFNPATWEDGEVPGEGAVVHIPAGVSVAYEGSSDANLFLVRVDGVLNMYAENGTATKMVVDTIVTSESSQFNVKARDASDGTVDVVFSEGAAAGFPDSAPGNGVNGRWTWDPEQLSLGLVASGRVDIKGQDVDAGLQLAEGPAAGATELVFNTSISDSGWAVGQQIVVGGTSYMGRDANGELITQDEVRTITSVQEVNGQMVVTLDAPLEYDHSGPADPETGLELTGHVGNLTRNVTFSSAAADRDGDGEANHGVSLGDPLGANEHYVTERGHIMFMHNDDVSVVDSAFFGLGRTDKTTFVDDIKTDGSDKQKRLVEDVNGNGIYDDGIDQWIAAEPWEIENPRGRYALHIHEAKSSHDHHCANETIIGPCAETGAAVCPCGSYTLDQDGDGIANARDNDYFHGAFLEGNVVWGSPGWGIVQHSSDAVLEGNTVFDVAGSAIVAESGDEAGRWEDNLTIGTYGAGDVSANHDDRNFNEDEGISGNGYYLKGRAIDMVDNVAQTSARAGFFYHNMGAGLKEVLAEDLGEVSSLALGRDSVPVEDVAIRTFTGNEVIAAREGVRVATDPHDSVRKFSDAYSHMQDFLGWEIDEAGVSITYSSKYIFEDFTILGTENKVTDDALATNAGFYFKASVADITVLNSHVEHFQNGVTNWVQVGNRQEYRRGYWDPKSPMPGNTAPVYDGMGAVDGIDNVAHNLWNTNVIGLTTDNLGGIAVRSPSISVETSDGVFQNQRGVEILQNTDNIEIKPSVDIELLGDSRDGGLVALWREDIANHPNQALMLTQHIPLAYNSTAYLDQVVFENGQTFQRNTFMYAVEGINDDIWSGTILEFAKEDSIGRHVFNYGDFAPLDPSSIERSVTTNERLIYSKEMIDGTLQKTGYYTVDSAPGMKFVVMETIWTDRLTGQLTHKGVLVALDTAWVLPEGTVSAGLLQITDNLIVAPQYRVFTNGVLDPTQPPVIVEDAEASGVFTPGGPGPGSTDQPPDTLYSEGSFEDGNGNELPPPPSVIHTAQDGSELPPPPQTIYSGAPVLAADNGEAIANGTTGADAFDASGGGTSMVGDDGGDWLPGDDGADRLWGEGGDDDLFGEGGSDDLFGGDGDDNLDGGAGEDRLFGGDGADVIAGGAAVDQLSGGAGADRFVFDKNSGDDVIVDFEDGVDAIDFMIQSFGFEDLEILQEGDDAIVRHEHGELRLVATDGDVLDEGDFTFSSPS